MDDSKLELVVSFEEKEIFSYAVNWVTHFVNSTLVYIFGLKMRLNTSRVGWVNLGYVTCFVPAPFPLHSATIMVEHEKKDLISLKEYSH